MSISPTVRRSWRRLSFRLSVRALMVLVLLVGGGVGWMVHRVRAQRDIVQVIERAGGHVIYGFVWLPRDPVNGDAIPGWAAKFVDAIGPEYVCDVLEANLSTVGNDHDRDALMVQVGRLHRLRGLYLWGSKSLTDAGLAHLRRLTNLEDLRLGGTHVSGAGLRYLSGMTKLRILVLPGGALRDGDLVHLKGLSKLESLCVSDEAPGITDAGLVDLPGLTSLEDLELHSPRVTSAGLEAIRTLTNLESINLDYSKITGLTPFQYFPKLERLSLANTPVDDAALAPAFQLSGLTTLNLNHTKVTDAGLPHLRPLKKLTHLTLVGTNTSGEAIVALGKMRLPAGAIGSSNTAP